MIDACEQYAAIKIDGKVKALIDGLKGNKTQDINRNFDSYQRGYYFPKDGLKCIYALI